MLIRAHHYATGQLVDLTWTGGCVESVGVPGAIRPDLTADWIAPAFFDLQINGCGGHSFSSAALTPDDVRLVVDVCRQHGIAGLCPTLVTHSFEVLAHGFATLR